MVEENQAVAEQDVLTDGQTTESNPQDAQEAETDGEDTLLGKQPEAVKQVAPEKYEFKVPEGMEVDSSLVEAVTPVFKEIGISQDQSQKLVDAYAPIVQKNMQAQEQLAVDTWNKQVDGWKAQTTKDLGTNLTQDLGVASRFIDKFGSPELRKVLNDTGLGNHPEVVKAFVKAGKAISEDTFIDPAKTNQASEQAIDLKKMYPSMNK